MSRAKSMLSLYSPAVRRGTHAPTLTVFFRGVPSCSTFRDRSKTKCNRSLASFASFVRSESRNVERGEQRAWRAKGAPPQEPRRRRRRRRRCPLFFAPPTLLESFSGCAQSLLHPPPLHATAFLPDEPRSISSHNFPFRRSLFTNRLNSIRFSIVPYQSLQ